MSLGSVYAYSAYGEVAVLGPDDANSLRYTGRDDDNTGLLYYRARYYDPVLKRFITEDPIGLLSGGANLYAYVNGNPVQYADPTGNLTPLGAALLEIALAVEHRVVDLMKARRPLPADRHHWRFVHAADVDQLISTLTIRGHDQGDAFRRGKRHPSAR